MVVEIIINLLFIYWIVYAAMKEREDLTCDKLQCDYDESVYVRGTKSHTDDNCDTLLNKLTSILSYHEKGRVWRRCLILSVICIFCIYIVCTGNIGELGVTPRQYWMVGILLFAVIYLYHNFLNFHIFRTLKSNGKRIVERIRQQCMVTN